MATTTYFSIPLPGDGSQDWVTVLNRAIAAVTEKIVLTQTPTGVAMKWGDIAGGKYLLVSAAGGVQVVGGFDHGSTPGSNLGLPQGEAFPTDTKPGDVFFRTDEDIVYYRNADDDDWVAMNTLDAGAVAALGALMVSDLGSTKGNFIVRNSAGAALVRSPGANDTVLVADSTVATGWTAMTLLTLLGKSMAKGRLVVGIDGTAAAQVVVPGANNTILTAQSGVAQGVAYKTFTELLATVLTSAGQILTGGGVVLDVPASNDRVLVSDDTAASGFRWALQTELGSIPGTRTRVAGDLYLYANFT